MQSSNQNNINKKLQKDLTIETVIIDNISVSKTEYWVFADKDITKSGYDALGVIGYSLENASIDGYGVSCATVMRCCVDQLNHLAVTIANPLYNTLDMNLRIMVYICYQLSTI